MDWLAEVKVEESPPIYVIPARTLERILAEEASRGNNKEPWHLCMMRDLVSWTASHP